MGCTSRPSTLALPYLATMKKLEITSNETEYKAWTNEVLILLEMVDKCYPGVELQNALYWDKETEFLVLKNSGVPQAQHEASCIVYLALGRSMTGLWDDLMFDRTTYRARRLWKAITEYKKAQFREGRCTTASTASHAGVN